MHPHYRGVALLLSLGSLPIACNDKDPSTTPDTADTGNGPNPGTDSNSTSPVDPTTGPEGTTEAVTQGTTEDPDTTTESPATTFVTTESMTVPPTEGTTGPVFPPPRNPVCQGYVDHFLMCNPRYAEYASYAGYSCDQYIMYGMQADGQACADAIEALFVCFNASPCEPPEDACAQQDTAVTMACPNFGEPSTSGSDTFGDDTGTTG
jgi:hypothetical protein